MSVIIQKQSGRRHRPEGTAADYDNVESAWPPANVYSRAIDRFLQRVA